MPQSKKTSKDLEDSNAAVLRTSADIASHSLTQLEVLAKNWPEFASDTKAFRVLVERLVLRATEYGYIEKRGKV